jgi:hypothetical protein
MAVLEFATTKLPALKQQLNKNTYPPASTLPQTNMLRTTRLLAPVTRRAPIFQHRMQSTYQPPEAPKPETETPKSNPHVGQLQHLIAPDRNR